MGFALFMQLRWVTSFSFIIVVTLVSMFKEWWAFSIWFVYADGFYFVFWSSAYLQSIFGFQTAVVSCGRQHWYVYRKQNTSTCTICTGISPLLQESSRDHRKISPGNASPFQNSSWVSRRLIGKSRTTNWTLQCRYVGM